MSNYNWCHGPECHKQHTQSRIRGSGRDKVLRTIRIKENKWNIDHAFKYFCNQNCLYQFINHHLQSVIAIAPRREALETPIKIEKEKYESHRYRHDDNGNYQREPYQATRTTIKSVDSNNG